MRTIVRKYPTRFSSINSWGGPKTLGRSALAKKYRKLRKAKQEFEKKYHGNKMLSVLGLQRDVAKQTRKAAKRRAIPLPMKG